VAPPVRRRRRAARACWRCPDPVLRSYPELEPLPRITVLTKPFICCATFPGASTPGSFEVEALPRRQVTRQRAGRARGDGVSRLIITRMILPAPGRRDRRQPMLPWSRRAAPARVAFRAGVNIVMYTLTATTASGHVRRCSSGWDNRESGESRLLRSPWSAPKSCGGHRVPSISLLLFVSRSRGAVNSQRWRSLCRAGVANPSADPRGRDPLSLVAIVVVDKSPSQSFGDRTAQTKPRCGGGRAIEPHTVRSARVEAARRRRDRRHAIVRRARFHARRRAVRPRRRRRHDHDGRVHDVPAMPARLLAAPVHALITGPRTKRDRRVALNAAPRSASSASRRRDLPRRDHGAK